MGFSKFWVHNLYFTKKNDLPLKNISLNISLVGIFYLHFRINLIKFIIRISWACYKKASPISKPGIYCDFFMKLCNFCRIYFQQIKTRLIRYTFGSWMILIDFVLFIKHLLNWALDAHECFWEGVDRKDKKSKPSTIMLTENVYALSAAIHEKLNNLRHFNAYLLLNIS